MTDSFENLVIEGHKVYAYETIDSTNLEAKRLAAKGASDGTVFTARAQTAGRGRRGRTWESPADANLYFTLLLRPQFASDKASMLTIVMALAVAKGILEGMGESIVAVAQMPQEGVEMARTQADGPARLGIKWPNDIWVDGKKVCGILTELMLAQTAQSGATTASNAVGACVSSAVANAYASIDNVIIGVGVNVERQDFPEELKSTAAALGEFGNVPTKQALLGAILRRFDALYAQFCAAGDLTPFLEEYRALSVNLGQCVRILDPKGEYEAIARDVAPTGELIVELPSGETKRIYAGEVSLRPTK